MSELSAPANSKRLAKLPLVTSGDVALARQIVLKELRARGVSAIRMTRFATAVSEIARNVVNHGGGGELVMFITPDTQNLYVRCRDEGPGINDLEQAMTDGYTSRDGLGRGLGGAQRLSDRFEIRSAVGQGTVVLMSTRL